MKTEKQQIAKFIKDNDIKVQVAGISDAVPTLKSHVAVMIANQNTAKGYPQDEDIQQAMAINAMRIESGIKSQLNIYL